MLKLLQNVIKAGGKILLYLPMPWRAGLVMLVVFTIAYWLLWRAGPSLIAMMTKLLLSLVKGFVSVILLAEYVITSHRRRKSRNPLPGT